MALIGLGPAIGTALGQPTFGRPKSKNPPPNAVDPRNDADGPRPTRIPPEEDWRNDDPPRRKPTPDAPGGDVFTWKTDDGTRYAWSLPFDFDATKPYNMIVLLHPARLDFRWGFSSHRRDRGGFHPNDVVVSVDGIGGDPRRPNQRFFSVSEENTVRFRDIMLELSRVFGPQHILLYGSGGAYEAGAGGTFALAFAGRFPALADGVLAHAAEPSPITITRSTVPIVFLHGAKDPFLDLAAPIDARDAYRREGHLGVRLRVLREFNDFPNPVRAGECLDFLEAMASGEPQIVLQRAERLLTPKPSDEFNYSAPVWYAGAYAALERLLGNVPNALPEVGEDIKAKAADLQERIDAESKAHIAALEPLLQAESVDQLALDGGAWLGYLLAFRDDFSGVPSAEVFVATLGLDARVSAHRELAQDMIDEFAQRDTADQAKLFGTVVETLPRCYLHEGLPVGLSAWTRAALRRADEIGITDEHKHLYEYVQLWERGWREGLNAYERRWRQWVFEPIAAPETQPPRESP